MKQRHKYGGIQPGGAEKDMSKQKTKAGKTPDYSTLDGKRRSVDKTWREGLERAEGIDASAENFLDGAYGMRRRTAVPGTLYSREVPCPGPPHGSAPEQKSSHGFAAAP